MNIRVDLTTRIKDGTEVVFRSPVDCSQVTGLKVYYIGEDGLAASKEFVLADAHGNNVGDIDHLFAENVAVKVILDVTKGMAFVQNADTNAYLEGRFAELEEAIAAGGGTGPAEVFIATYGETTYKELEDAYNAGMTLSCKDGTYYSPLFQRTASGSYTFYSSSSSKTTNRYCTASGGWNRKDMNICEDRFVELENTLGDIDTALDNIIAIQESLMGGDGV